MNVYDYIKPYGCKCSWEQYSPEKLGKDTLNVLNDFLNFLNAFPNEWYTQKSPTRATKGSEVRLAGFDRLIAVWHYTANRLALALIIATLILSGSLITAADILVHPSSLRYPATAIIMYVTAILLAIRLILVSFKNGSIDFYKKYNYFIFTHYQHFYATQRYSFIYQDC